jgi:hypothetical protein
MFHFPFILLFLKSFSKIQNQISKKQKIIVIATDKDNNKEMFSDPLNRLLNLQIAFIAGKVDSVFIADDSGI